jgi:hypothetical protein
MPATPMRGCCASSAGENTIHSKSRTIITLF